MAEAMPFQNGAVAVGYRAASFGLR